MRPSEDEVMLAVADKLSVRATCIKNKVGCVLTDFAGQILSTGYNGVPRNQPHCIEHPCVGATGARGSDTCQAVHAEINALLYCHDVGMIHTCYVTDMPCNSCMKALLNTNCMCIVTWKTLLNEEPAAAVLWRAAGRKIIRI